MNGTNVDCSVHAHLDSRVFGILECLKVLVLFRVLIASIVGTWFVFSLCHELVAPFIAYCGPWPR